MEHRSEHRKFEASSPDPPTSLRYPRESPVRSPGYSRTSPKGLRSDAPLALTRTIHPGASTVGELLLRPCPPEASRLPALDRGFSVLPVDDVPHRRIRLVRALRDQGHRVLDAADGASGETLCRASELEIDALVACADMGHMCGFELARRVVRMRAEVRVLLMWRHSVGPEETRCAHERGYAVIEEPFTPQQLCRRLTGLPGSPTNDAGAERGSTAKIVSFRARTKNLTPRGIPTAHGDTSMEPGEGHHFTDGRSEIAPEALPLVSCFWCERLHRGKHPLSVCPACAARFFDDAITDPACIELEPGGGAPEQEDQSA